MRSNLGRIFLIITIFLNFSLLASTYKWSGYANKTTAMTNEAIYLKYICEYSDEAELYNIEFNPVVENEKYSIELLSESKRIVDGKKINSFEFVVFVKEAGFIEFAFDTSMKKTNKDSIQNTVLGRDNADYEEFSTKIIRQNPIGIDIKKSGSDLVGNFTIDVKKDKEELKAYEAYNLHVIVDGIGNFKALKSIEFKIDGVKIFAQKPIKNIKFTKDGYKGSWSQKFAFVSEKDFEIPKFSIEYFDLKENKIRELIVNKIEVEVTPAYKKEELLDIEEDSSAFSFNFIFYILTFIAGYMFSKVKFKRETKVIDTTLEAKVKATKSLEELMIVLVLTDARKYERLIFKIENKDIISLKDAKASITETLQGNR